MINKVTSPVLFLLGVLYFNYVTSTFNNNKTDEGQCSKSGVQRSNFLHDSTRKFVHWLNRDYPVELVKQVIHNQKSKNKHLIKEIFYYERPFIAISGVLFFLAFIMLVSGIAISYQQIYQNVTSSSNKTSDFQNKWISPVNILMIVTISCLLAVTDVGLFLTNNRISENFPTTRKTLTKSIDDLLYVQNNTVKELNRILLDDFERAVGDSMTEFRALADCGSDIKSYSQLFRRNTLHFKQATEAATLALRDTKKVLNLMNLTLGQLETLSGGLKSELGKMDTFYKEAQRKCIGKGKSKDENLCQMFVNEKVVFTNGNLPLQASNKISVVISKLDKFTKTLNFTPIVEFARTQSGFERRLCKKRAAKLKELEKLYIGIRFARNFALDNVQKYSNELVDRTLTPIRRNINTVLAKDSSILTYDGYRWWITFFVAFTVLVALLTTMASVVVKGAEPYLVQVPSSLIIIKSMHVKVLLRRLFLSATVLHVSTAVVVTVCAGIVFFFVSNMAVACEISTDYKHIDDIFGTSDLLKKSKLFTHGHKPIKLFKTISECPKSGSVWKMLDLDKKFNIHKNISQKIPHITARLFRDRDILNTTLKKGSQKMQNILKEWKNIGVKNLNVDFILEHVDNPIVHPSFHRLSNALTSFRGNTGSNLEAPLELFRNMSNQAFIIEENYTKMYSVLSKLLNQHVKEFKDCRDRTSESFAKIQDLYSNITEERNLRDKNKNVDYHVMKIAKNVRIFLKDGVCQVKNSVGNCGVIKEAYSNAVCSLCDEMFGSWNIWWILSLVCSGLTTLSVVFCVLILKQISGNHSTK